MSEPSRPSALLRHDVPGIGSHFDLLLGLEAHPAPGDPCAMAWRSTVNLHDLAPGECVELTPILRHRGLYLELTEPIELSEGRGTVHPIAHGRWHAGAERDAHLLWRPHAPPMIVHFERDGEVLDARQPERLEPATRLRRVE
ncbi:MAG: hypothetical protein KF724_11155 [Phycisphaeraceae bacterium]|nr:hypothetical protein [Phycisphaeraceae bacterium]